MATAEVTPMLDVAPAAEVDAVEIPSLDATPNAETPAEVPAVESEADKTKTDDDKAQKSEDGKAATSDVTTAAAAFTPKAIVEKLSEIKKTDPALATRLHQEVKNSLESKRFLQSVGAKDFAEAKTLLSKPDEATEQFRQTVEASDELLYRGDLKELSNNILEDITAELGNAAPARLSELSESLLEKIEEVDPAGSIRIHRAQFLAASKESGLVKSLNSLHLMLSEGRTSEAKNLLSSIGRFFSEEMKANGEIAKTRTEAKATAEKTATAAVTALRSEVTKSVSGITNTECGSALKPFLSAQLKGLPKTDLIRAAEAIRTNLDQLLGTDEEWKRLLGPKWQNVKSKSDSKVMLDLYTKKLQSGIAKRVVEDTLRAQFPDRFKEKPAVPKAPASTEVTIGGKSQTVFQLAKRPTNLVRSDVEVAGRVYTSKELELLQTAKGVGLVPNKSGKGHSFVQWKR